ncbi:MAG: hypothetical protein ACM3PA_00260, partial [Methanomassiliicoccales archaeon]
MPPTTMAIIGVLLIMVCILLGCLFRMQVTKNQWEQKVALLSQEGQYQKNQLGQLATEESCQRNLVSASMATITELTARCSAAEARVANLNKMEQVLGEKD